jgi:hypothetical protein
MFFGKFPIRPVIIKSVQRLVTDDERQLLREASSIGLSDIPVEWLTPAIIESRTVLFEYTAQFGAPRNPTSGPVGSDSHSAALSCCSDLSDHCVRQISLDVHQSPVIGGNGCVVPVCAPVELIAQVDGVDQSLLCLESAGCEVSGDSTGVDVALSVREEKCEVPVVLKEDCLDDPCRPEPWMDASVYNRNVVAVMRNSKMCAAADYGFVCSQCWVPLDDSLNCDVEENHIEGKCRLCMKGQSVSPELKEIVMFQLEKECVKCFVLLTEQNCTKSQYRRTKSKCVACTDYASAFKQPAVPKLDRQEAVMRTRFELLKFNFGLVALDFECVEGDWRKVTQCGLTYFDPICEKTSFGSNCGAVIAENFVIVDNIDPNSDELPEDKFGFGSTRYVTFENFLVYLNFRIHHAQVVVVYDSNLEVKLLNLWGCDASKVLDFQLVVGIDSRRKLSLTNLLKRYGYDPVGMHCAGNDSYWIFVAYCRVSFESGYAQFTDAVNGEYYREMSEWLFSSAKFRDFVRFQLRVSTCDRCSDNASDFMVAFRRMNRHGDFDFDRLISYVRAHFCPVDFPVLNADDVGGVT